MFGKYLTKARAKEFAIKKWKHIVKNGGNYCVSNLIKEIPELKSFSANCSYCEKYVKRAKTDCLKCPLCITKKEDFDVTQFGCNQKYHPFSVWVDNTTKENAQKVLDFIKER